VHPATPAYCVIVGKLIGSPTLASRHGSALRAAMTEASEVDPDRETAGAAS
jgi:hypothetical protein